MARSRLSPIVWTDGLLGTLALGGAVCVPPADPPTPPASTRTQYIATYCATLTRCEDSFGRLYLDEAACQQYFEDFLRCGIEVQSGRLRQTIEVAYDEARGQACIAWLAGLSCDAQDLDSADCARAIGIAGASGEGESCESTLTTPAACGVDLYCERQSSDQRCDVCRREAAAGETCSDQDPRVPCADDHYCNPQSQRCSPLLDDGAVCSGDAQCDSGWCRALQCAQPLARGAPCASGDRCQHALRCAGGVCTDRAGLGAACDGTADCLQPAVCVDGTCARVGACERPAAGNACLYSCADGAYCAGNVCEPFVQAGAPCADHVQCGFPEAVCPASTGRCLALPALGEPCSATLPCQPLSATCDDVTDPLHPVCVAARDDASPCSEDGECLSGYCDEASDTCGDRAVLCALP